MARPKSDDKRSAILAAAVRVLVKDGLGAATAAIAAEAGVANGSLFTYFPTKSALYNELYRELKAGMASAALVGVPTEGSLRDRFSAAWTSWMTWAVQNPEHRRVLNLLAVADDLSDETRQYGHAVMAPLAALMEQGRADGPLRHAPIRYVGALMNAVAEATMDAMRAERDPALADARCVEGFDALWRLIR